MQTCVVDKNIEALYAYRRKVARVAELHCFLHVRAHCYSVVSTDGKVSFSGNIPFVEIEQSQRFSRQCRTVPAMCDHASSDEVHQDFLSSS